jgi:hypothetical protein
MRNKRHLNVIELLCNALQLRILISLPDILIGMSRSRIDDTFLERYTFKNGEDAAN